MGDQEKKEIKIALDAMGGDNAPAAIVEGALRAANEEKRIHVIFVGRKEDIDNTLAGKEYPKAQVSVREASEVIEMAEHPVAAIRGKKDSSLVVGMKMVKNGEADAFVSAGNSGAVLVGAQTIVGRIRGIERPPFASIIPTQKGMSLLLDCGANVDARPSHLVQFARIGSIYMKHVMGVEDPTVGILNIGAEEEKGNALVRETFPLLRECGDIHFVGSVEARDVPFGSVDVVVCEGFAGNVVLKMYEGTASMLLGTLKQAMTSSLKSKIGALLVKGSLKEAMKKYDAAVYGGAPMLGCRNLVVKMHGSSKAEEVYHTMFQCMNFADADLSRIIEENIPDEGGRSEGGRS